MASATSAGFILSGSANTMSKATSTAPICIRFWIIRATIVRDQGHCPISAKLRSSRSMMVTGRCVTWRGLAF